MVETNSAMSVLDLSVIRLIHDLFLTGTRCKFHPTYGTLNSGIIHMEYAVRGQIPQEAKKIEAELKKVHCFFVCDTYTICLAPCTIV